MYRPSYLIAEGRPISAGRAQGSDPLFTWTPTPYGRILPVSALQRPDWRRIMATTVGKVTIWSIVTLAAIVVIALILVSR